MKKSDLKNGDIVELRDGGKYILIEDILIGIGGGWLSLQSYNENMREDKYIMPEYDITKVFQGEIYEIGEAITEKPIWTWIRDEKKEMTIAEIEKELGYEVEIIKEK